jgi:hypothetical protein
MRRGFFGERAEPQKDNNGGHLGHQPTPSQKDINSLSTKKIIPAPLPLDRLKNEQKNDK